MFEESSVEAYIDGASFHEDMLASQEEVGRDANGDLAEKTTLRRPLQAGEPWLLTDAFRPHAMRDAALHATPGQCVSHHMLSLATKPGPPIWSPEELDDDFTTAYQNLYAGKFINPIRLRERDWPDGRRLMAGAWEGG